MSPESNASCRRPISALENSLCSFPAARIAPNVVLPVFSGGTFKYCELSSPPPPSSGYCSKDESLISSCFLMILKLYCPNTHEEPTVFLYPSMVPNSHLLLLCLWVGSQLMRILQIVLV